MKAKAKLKTFRELMRVILISIFIMAGINFLLMIAIVVFTWAYTSLPFTSYSIRRNTSYSSQQLRSVATALKIYYLDIDKSLPPDANGWSFMTTPRGYMRSPTIDPMARDEQPVQFFTAGTKYTIYSVGPNRKLDLSPSKIARGGESAITFYTYDVSNGTRSGGDLVLVGDVEQD